MAFLVALVAIAIAPKSPVRLDIATVKLTGLDRIVGLTPGVVVDSAGRLPVEFTDPSLGVRLLNLAVFIPGLLLVAEIARRMARLLRAAEQHDPFTHQTVRALGGVARLTAIGGVGVWAIAAIARWVLSSHVLSTGTDVTLLRQSPVGWLGVALIIAGFSQVVARGVAMRTELDAVI